MTLTKEMLSKTLSKGRQEAVLLLLRISRLGGFPEPVYKHSAEGGAKNRTHLYEVRFQLPQFLLNIAGNSFSASRVVKGAGRCSTRRFARSLAALETIHFVEDALEVERGDLQKRVDDFVEARSLKHHEFINFPADKELPGVSWENIPIDPSISEILPAGRAGKIHFFPALLRSPNAFLAAKAITLASQDCLPEVAVHADQTAIGYLPSANVRAAGRISGITGSQPLEQSVAGVEAETATVQAFEDMWCNLQRRKVPVIRDIVGDCERGQGSSYGMAKLFVSLPKHQFQDLELLLDSVADYQVASNRNETQRIHRHIDRRSPRHSGVEMLNARLASFRSNQTKLPLPVDSVENMIPHDASVTIVRGGTGSGKTTRYPLMLSLFSPTGDSTKILVAQPRRLACQTAARRVAYEQGFQIGSDQCPIGYAIRFESKPSSAYSRTIDFQTSGVLLRRAAEDPLLSDVTHLCIDEIHERNADMDLLLALAKQALIRRARQTTLPPLRLVLMSATLDSSHWESYFRDDDLKISVAVVDVPDARRFPIETIHVCDKVFPLPSDFPPFLESKKSGTVDHEETLCTTMAALAVRLYNSNRLDGGSILCFLPGMDEIRRVHRYMNQLSRRRRAPNVIYLHSSISSGDQAKAFEPGSKIILVSSASQPTSC